MLFTEQVALQSILHSNNLTLISPFFIYVTFTMCFDFPNSVQMRERHVHNLEERKKNHLYLQLIRAMHL